MELIKNDFSIIDELKIIDRVLQDLENKTEKIILRRISNICKENNYTSLSIGKNHAVVKGTNLKIMEWDPDFIKDCEIHKLCTWFNRRFSSHLVYYCELGEFKNASTEYVDVPIPEFI